MATSDSGDVNYSGVNSGGLAIASWTAIEGGLQQIEPVTVSSAVTEYNPLFGERVGKYVCGDAYASQDSQDSDDFHINGSFNVCTGTIPNMTLQVIDLRADGTVVNSDTTSHVLADMERFDKNLQPPLMSELTPTQNGCDIIRQNKDIDEWDVGKATIEVSRNVECYLCKSTIPSLKHLALDSDSGHFTDSDLQEVIHEYCITINCSDSELDSSTGNVCFADDNGKFDCSNDNLVPQNIIQQRIYGTSSKPTTACGPMATIGRAIASEWQQDVRGAIF